MVAGSNFPARVGRKKGAAAKSRWEKGETLLDWHTKKQSGGGGIVLEGRKFMAPSLTRYLTVASGEEMALFGGKGKKTTIPLVCFLPCGGRASFI